LGRTIFGAGLFLAAGQGGRTVGSASLANVAACPTGWLGDDNVILVDRHKVMLIELNAAFRAAKFGESAAEPAA
jgi:hypothetical protein